MRSFTLIHLTEALILEKDFEEAEQACRTILEIWPEDAGPVPYIEAHISLGYIHSLTTHAKQDALHEIDQALTLIEKAGLDTLESNFHGMCYSVLQGFQDPRATEILKTAHQLLQEKAQKITDQELRHSFLYNVEVHRNMIESYEALTAEELSN